MTVILAVVNQKGGVGKTTTSINVSTYLASRGKRTLLIDMDPQGNATSGLGIDKVNVEKSIYDVVVDEMPIEQTLISSGRKQLKVCPANIDLAGAEVELVNLEERETRLKKQLEKTKNNFDFIIIDCPPSLSMLTLNALTASDGIIIPIQSEYFALEGLTQVLDTYKLVKNYLNPNLQIFGFLVTMYDSRTSLSQSIYQEIVQTFGEQVFKTIIPRNVRLSEAPSFGKSIQEFDKKSKGAEAYHNLSKEIIQRAKLFKKEK